jgi:hypothetical protein
VAWSEIPESELRINELPYFGVLEAGPRGHTILRHYGGLPYMTVNLCGDRGRSGRVIRDYGLFDDSNMDEIEVRSRLWKDFPARSSDIDTLLTMGCAWVAPDGAIYPCMYGEHSDLADRIAWQFGVEYDAYDVGRIIMHGGASDALLRTKWLVLSPHFIYADRSTFPRSATRRQLAVLREVIERAEQKQLHDHVASMVRACERFVLECEVGP